MIFVECPRISKLTKFETLNAAENRCEAKDWNKDIGNFVRCSETNIKKLRVVVIRSCHTNQIVPACYCQAHVKHFLRDGF